MSGPTAVQPKACPQCGVSIPSDAPGGFCPRCALTWGLKCDSHEPPDSPEAGALLAIRYFGDYELLEEIARGGMGVVYRARQLTLNRIVAVKMILASRLATPAEVDLFHAEASTAARLNHPGIVGIHEVGEHEGQHFYSMDYVDGQCLGHLVRNGPLPSLHAAHYLRAVAEAVQYAHSHGILHRDLKPSNILIDAADRPRVTDFGLAKELTGRAELTLSGQILGSPNFMPPEQAVGKRARIGPYGDVYSLGAILYQMLTGRPPFVAETVTATLSQVISADPVPPRTLNPSVPRDLETICLKCLEKAPDKRYPTARALGEDLDRFLRREPVRARPVTTAEKAWRWCRRKPVVASLGAAVVLLLVAVATVSTIAALRVAAAREQESLQRQAAQHRELVARQNEYAADMSLAQQALADRNLGRALELLEKHRPVPGQTDLRGWEWRYLRRQSQSDELFTFHQGSNWVSALAISFDGKRLVSSDSGGWLHLWDMPNKVRMSDVLHQQLMWGIAFSHDSRWLAASTGNGQVTLFDAATLQPVVTLDHMCLGYRFGGDGRSILTVSARQARRWTVPNGMEIERFNFTLDADSSASNEILALAPDGQRIAWGSLDSGVRIWNLSNSVMEATVPRDNAALAFRLAFSPDSQILAVGCTDGAVRLWSISDRRLLHVLAGHTTFVTIMVFSPNGTMLATCGYEQTIVLWNTVTGERINRFMGHRGEVIALKFTPDGKQLVTAGKDGTIRFWDAGARARRDSTLDFPRLAPRSALASSNHQVLTHTYEGSLHLWDAASLREIARHLTPETNVSAVALAPDGAVVATGSADGTVRLWRWESDHLSMLITFTGHTGSVSRVVFSPDGRFLASVGEDRQSRIWDIRDRGDSTRLDGALYEGGVMAFSPDGAVLATGDGKGSVDLWDLRHGRRGRRFSRFSAHQLPIMDVAFSGNCLMVATAGFDRTVKLWDIASAPEVGELATFTGSVTPVWSVAFSPDDARLVAGLGDGEVRIWNVATHREILRLKGHKLPVFAVGFRGPEDDLVSVGGDSLCVWKASPLNETNNSAAVP